MLFYENNYIEKRIINKNNDSTIKITTMESLLEIIYFLEPKSFNYFLEKGLNRECREKTTLAILTTSYNKKSIKEVIKYHCFNNSKLETMNDIPLFYPDVPDGFSLFCCKLEHSQLMNYINNSKYIKKKEKKSNSEENYILETEPAPNKRHFLCQICKTKFHNYKEHMNSKLHWENRLKFMPIFQSIKATFRRIVDFNNLNKRYNNYKVFQPMSIDIKNSLTKEASDSIIVINDENDDCNGNKAINMEKYTKKSDEVIVLMENEEINDLNYNDILNILNSINSKKSRNNMNFPRKRGRNKKDIDFFDDYIHGLKKITGRISLFNRLNEQSK